MTNQNCHPSSPASFYGPSLLNYCTATTFLAFITNIESKINKSNVISGVNERIEPIEVPDKEYDFVVIGGGAAGSVVASRLSENPKWKVLLVEAGPDEPAALGVPGFADGFLTTNTIWNYTTTNESKACRARNGSCPCPSGRNLAGNTAHNGLIYLRGNPTDYNNWAALGNEGWSWEEVKEFFIKSEKNGEIERVGRKHHGTEGPLSVERSPYIEPIGLSILEAADEIGYGVSEDLNGDQFTGFSWTQSTIKKGVRSSAASAFLRPARNRENLHVSLDSQVTRVLIEKKKAVGVEYYKNGELKKVYARKEVIVSGGAMNSPQILLLSGIGPKEHLESVGVPVILDLSGVGQNFHDHPGTAVAFTIDRPDTYANNWDVATQYLENQTGPLSAYGTLAVVGVVATDMTKPDYPDMQIYNLDHVAACAPGEVGALQSNGKRIALFAASLLHPKTKGTVTLASNNPLDYPILRAEYLKHPDDLKAQVKGLRKVQAIAETKALESYNLTLIPVEACSNYELGSDEYWACAALQDNYAMYHFAGSCKMGPASDRLAVVDPRLKVYGIEGLRVADASIMPQVTSSNTQAPTYMIGERAADFIKKDWAETRTTKHQHKIQTSLFKESVPPVRRIYRV